MATSVECFTLPRTGWLGSRALIDKCGSGGIKWTRREAYGTVYIILGSLFELQNVRAWALLNEATRARSVD